jgi:hypothetical protein
MRLAAGPVNFLAEGNKTDCFVISVISLKPYLTLDLIVSLYR